VRDATTFAPPCAQPRFDDAGNVVGTLGREDCLNLNVFAPAAASPGDRLPVLVHLHGGGNSVGAPYENVSAFVDRGEIVVTVAYRLGVFGFVGHPALSAEGGGSSGEYGVLDQIAALRWVRDNVAAFGGDPGNVTLAGLSAGSFDTVAIMASPLARGLITRAAVQGEAFWPLTGVFNHISDAEQLGLELANAIGCSSAACLRAVPADVITSVGFLDITPWVGGVVLPASPLELLSRDADPVPLLIGFDREEDAVFELRFVPEVFETRHWVHNTNLLVGNDLGEQARKLYPPSDYESTLWAYITMATDAKRGCPTRRLANAVAARAPVYRWLFTHVFENDPALAGLKASHAFEEPFIWGDFDPFLYTPTAAETLLADRMSDYWANFVRGGDPNGPGLPAWPPYDETEPTLALDDTIAVTRGYHVPQCALLDTIAAPFERFPRGKALGLIKF
jgi:para-nitrobenzyl esterase